MVFFGAHSTNYQVITARQSMLLHIGNYSINTSWVKKH